ncbi:germinal-center associated nuclear protein [Bombina bombina]|uniref:germinal-center associated nuclear protein n=1 Tax=Bombina bombina TaxID=8345 RepID=UPI00235A7715|nr:germinal-center associated nuclear protein [Bombina bombina]XP_053554867.1 germinal-center associated nuclear protein [Bombina bombina]
MNSNNLYGQSPLFGQVTSGQHAPVFGQSSQAFGQGSSSQPALSFGQHSSSQQSHAFGQASLGQTPPVFGQTSSGQPPPAFGQVSSGQQQLTFGQASSGQQPPFGQASSGQKPLAFGQSSSGHPPAYGQASLGQQQLMFGQTSSSQQPAFGQTSSSQQPAFGQASSGQQLQSFGQTSSGQQPLTFGQASSSQQLPAFGQSSSGQQLPAFGQTASTGQQAPSFGQTASTGQQAPSFGQTASTGQQAPAFGQTATTGQQAPAFGQTATTGQQAPAFGQTATTGQQAPAFGQTASTGQQAPAFGQTASTGQQTPAFGQASSTVKQAPAFGQSASTNQQAPAFGQSASTGQQAPAFGQSASTGQQAPAFGQSASTGQQAPAFGQASSTGQQVPAFGQASSTGQQAPSFGQASSTGQQTPAFGQSVSTGQQTSAFGQPVSTGQQMPAFGQSVSTGQQTPAFGQSVSTGQQTPAFGQSVSTGQQTPAFGQSVSTGQQVPAFGQATSEQSSSAFGRTAPIFGQVSTGSSSLFEQSTSGQSSLFGSAVSSHNSVFGQATSGQSFGFGQTSQNPLFGNVPTSQGFGSEKTSSTPISSSFGQISTSVQNTLFSQAPGQPPPYGKTSTGQNPGFGKETSSQPPTYAQATNEQKPAFGFRAPEQTDARLPFPQSTSASTQNSVFGINVIQSQIPSSVQPTGAFGSTQLKNTVIDAKHSTLGNTTGVTAANLEHTFKPPENATFKPIFGAVSESDKSQNQRSTLSFNASKSEHNTFGSFTGETPSSSFSLVAEKNKEESFKPVFGTVGSSFTSFVNPASSSRPSHIGESPEKEDLPKGQKRKEESGRSPLRHVLPPSDMAATRTDHPPDKRPTRLGRQLAGGANLYVRSLYDVVRSHMNPRLRKESNREDALPSQHTDSEQDLSASIQQDAGISQPAGGRSHSSGGLAQSAPNRSQPLAESSQPVSSRARPSSIPSRPISIGTRQTLDEESPTVDTTAFPNKTPLRRVRRSVSSDSTEGLSQSEMTTIQLKNVPNNVNQKQKLEKFFGKFGNLKRVYCRTDRKLAIIHFHHSSSAMHAKRMVKKLHKDVSAFWQKKKHSPNKRETLPSKKENANNENIERQSEEETSSSLFPARKSLLRDLTGGRGPKGSPHKKSLLSATVQLDKESADSLVSLSDTTGVSIPPSLFHLVGTEAEGSEEKYRLLDQRDKILRQARVKRTELDQAKVFVGTCPDMCPEKERYMRETRNQLSVFELIPGTDKLDHAAAIKEYSRSSADQEEPLPHELRPTPVLSMTMDYLVTRVMDQGEGNYRDWYDFVWNRTRGIRKDITQQHLCDPVTVSLMEKCMRFHVHCAHQLCEEPMSSFEPKINNENLTKCLQSLKEMYQDLQNRGISCPSEPEFRGYSVLLNLNKGDILWEVQQFRPSVRNSAEVKFAVQVFAALNSTNFVRFFRLFRSASYLNSCILHCYFNQIRRDALRALNVAYTVGTQRSTSFPLESIVRMLLFHDADEATEFLTSYGLTVSDGSVELSRVAYLEPEVPPHPRKCSFISQKCNVSVGEVVNGAPLPQFSLHIPICSFDAQNKYVGSNSTIENEPREVPPAEKSEEKIFEPEIQINKQTAVLLPDAKEPSPFASQSVFQPIMPPVIKAPSPPKRPPSPPKPLYCDEDIAAVVEGVVDELVREHSAELGQSGAAFVSSALRESSNFTDGLLTDVISDILRQVAGEELRAEVERVKAELRRKSEEAKVKLERERLLSMLSQSLCQELMKEVLSQSIYDVTSAELRQAIQLAHNACIARCSQYVSDQYVDQFLQEETFQVARESLHEMQCCSKYLQRWREVLAARKKLRRQMRGFPAAPGSVGCDDKLKALIPSARACSPQNMAEGILDMGHAGKLGVSFTKCQRLREQTFHEMKVQHFYQLLLCDAAWAPLDLPPLVVQRLPSWRECVFWKLVLILPQISEPGSVLCDWLKAKLSGPSNQLVEQREQRVQTLALYNSLESQEGRSVRVNVCVKVAYGPLTPSEMEEAETQKELLGTSGFVLLLPPRDNVTEEDVYWLSAILHLKQMLQAKPFLPPPPLAVLVPWPCQESVSEVEEGLNLPELHTCGLISEYLIVSIPDYINDMQGTKEVSRAVHFLLSHSPRSLELCSLPLQQYIEDGLCHIFADSFYLDMQERRQAGMPSQDPAAIIDLYNEALLFLAAALSSELFSDISWPMIEFTCHKESTLLPQPGWNSPCHLAWLKQAVLSFQIPQMDMPPPGAPWLPVCSMILEYVSQICTSPQALPVLLSEVQCLLGRTYRHWREMDLETKEKGPPVQDIPWDDLLTLCINHRLREWNPPMTPSATGPTTGELYVYFMQDELKNFVPPKSWTDAQLDTHRDMQRSPGRCHSSLQQSQALRPFGVNAYESLVNPEVNKEQPYTSHLPQQLKYSLKVEKEESRRFEETLERLVAEGPLDQSASLSLPMYLPEALLGDLETTLNLTDITECTPAVRESLTTYKMCFPSAQRLRTESAVCAPHMQGSLMDSTISFPSVQRSVTDNMNTLRRLLQVSQQEDAAYELHLKTLLDVGDHR